MSYRFLGNLFLGTVLGSLLAFCYFLSTQNFKDYLQTIIEKNMQEQFGCKVLCKVDSINLIHCNIVLKHFHLGQNQELKNNLDWTFSSETVTIQGEWLSILFKQKLQLKLYFDQVIMFEEFETWPEKLVALSTKIFKNAQNPYLCYDGTYIRSGTLYLKKHDHSLYIEIPCHANLHASSEFIKMQLYPQDGSIKYQNNSSINGITGTTTVQIPSDLQDYSKIELQTNMHYKLNYQNLCLQGFLIGQMSESKANFITKTTDGSIALNQCRIEYDQEHIWCNIDTCISSKIAYQYLKFDWLKDVESKIYGNISCDLNNIFKTLECCLDLTSIKKQDQPITPQITCCIKPNVTDQNLCITVECNNNKILHATCSTDDENYIIQAQNAADYLYQKSSLNFFAPASKNSYFASFNRTDGLFIKSDLTIINNNIGKPYRMLLNLKADDKLVHIYGSCNEYTIDTNLLLKPSLLLESLSIANNSTILLNLETEANDPIMHGSIDFSLISLFVPDWCKKSFVQQGSINFQAYQKDFKTLIQVQTDYANIRIPWVYNVIQNINGQTTINWFERTVTMDKLFIHLHQGSIDIHNACWIFDASAHCIFSHIPIIFNQVMMQPLQGLYSLINGYGVYEYQKDIHHKITSNLFLVDAQLRNNIFSSAFLSTISNQTKESFDLPNIACSISCSTAQPVAIITPFLTGKAIIDLKIQGSILEPKPDGIIKILPSVLHFAYKPLDLIDAHIIFKQDQPFDPSIQLNAQAKLKKYLVSINAWGTAQHPHLSFHSEPHLQEEQIISLLMLGVEDQALSLMIPAFLTQKINDLLFGPMLSAQGLHSFFDTLVSGLRYIRFIPQLTNQAGRGGVRGIFEIEPFDSLHAKIDTNFSHLEDTKFDIDYAATDDITLRLQKDGPSTYAGEVELRWKF